MSTTPSEAHIQGKQLLLKIDESVKAAYASLSDTELAMHRVTAVGSMICLARGRAFFVADDMVDDYLRAVDSVIILAIQTLDDIKARRELA